MGIRSHVMIAVYGPKDKVAQFANMCPNFGEWNEYDNSENIIEDDDDGNSIWRWENDWIKWPIDIEVHHEEDEIGEFLSAWEWAEENGLDGKIVECCYEYPDLENGTKIINDGASLREPCLVYRCQWE